MFSPSSAHPLGAGRSLGLSGQPCLASLRVSSSVQLSSFSMSVETALWDPQESACLVLTLNCSASFVTSLSQASFDTFAPFPQLGRGTRILARLASFSLPRYWGPLCSGEMSQLQYFTPSSCPPVHAKAIFVLEPVFLDPCPKNPDLLD